MNHDSISDIRALLHAEGIALKKRFGQNFLVRTAVRERIVRTIGEGLEKLDATSDRAERAQASELWEIGPGLGSLTDSLLPLGYPLRVFEIDRALIRLLHANYGERIAIEEGDATALIATLLADTTHSMPVAVVGNLPYRSASAIIASLIETPRRGKGVAFLLFLVQEELAARLAAGPGSKDYGALSVLVQNSYLVAREFSVPGSAFYPVPHVESRVVSLMVRDDAPAPRERAITSVLARRAFAQRRKTLRNTLSPLVGLLESCGIDPAARPETIEPARFLTLARTVTAQPVLPEGIDWGAATLPDRG